MKKTPGGEREERMADQGLKAMAGTKAPKFGHFIVEFATPASDTS